MTANYTPSDTANYNDATVSVAINVLKATPAITWSNPPDIVYGTALGGAQLNATSSAPGAFTYAPSAGTVLNAGSGQTLTATFTPSDAANYNGATASVAINVSKSTPAITWSNPADIIYGTALGGAQLNATSSAPGAFTYTPSAGTVLNAGSGQTLRATFTPSDAANYDGATASVAINVSKATPAITWGNPEDIVYGTALGAAQLNASSSVPGAFTYTPSAGTVLNAGSGQALTATFSPSDTANYNGATASVAINVLKKGQTISFGPLGNKTYGNPDFTVSATADSGLPVSFTAAGSCTIAGNTVHLAGAGTCTVTAHQPGDANHNAASDIAQGFTITKGTPTLTWANPADIVYGTALGATQLNATANVLGAFAYAPAAGTVLNAGSGQTLSVTFTPTDAANYTFVSGSVVINVLKKGQAISFGPLGNKTYGNPDFTVNATADSGLPVTFTAVGSCTVSGNTVHLVAAGTCTVTAHQPGNANFSAAPDVPQSFTVFAPPVDLTETTVNKPPATAAWGESFSVTDTVLNRGSALAALSTTRYYISSTPARTVGSLLLTGTRSVAALAAGATSKGTVNVMVPIGAIPASYYLLACADDLNVVAESDESNNCIASTTQVKVTAPDLVEKSITNPPTTISRGSKFSVTDVAGNIGTATSGKSTMTRYYLSTQPTTNSGATLLTGTRTVSAVAAGATSSGTTQVTVPTSTTVGTYYLRACTDDTNLVSESDEANNCLGSTKTVVVK